MGGGRVGASPGCGRVGAGIASVARRRTRRTASTSDRGLRRSNRSAGTRGTRRRHRRGRPAARGRRGADVFYALTEGDNRNILAAQLASESLDVGRVVAKINDPVRAEAYAALGIATLCRTGLMLDAVNAYVGMARPVVPGVRAHRAPPRWRAS